jgi:hypothetical protein
VPLRTSKAQHSAVGPGVVMGFKQEDGGVSSSLSCDFVILLGRLLLPPGGKACGKAFRRKTTSQSTGAKHLDTQATTPLAVRLGARQGSGKESHRGARIARR